MPPSSPPTPETPAVQAPRAKTSRLVIIAGIAIVALVIGAALVFFLRTGCPSWMTFCSAENAGPPTVTGTPGVPQIVVTKYPSKSVIIASYVVTGAPYNADMTGKTDATAAFQKALDDAGKNGGGTVYAPAGTYRFDGSLTIPQAVTLRGDWKQPTDKDQSVGGTVFAVYGGSGTATGPTFIQLSGGAGVQGISFWYPNQSITAPIEYPGTIGLSATAVTLRESSMQDLTFVNSWTGIDTLNPTTKSDQDIYIYDIYGLALDTGLILDDTSSVCSAEEVHLAPKYWSSSGLPGAPSTNDLTAYTETHATGFSYNDNWQSYDNSVDGFDTGILLLSESGKGDTVTGPRFVGISITNAHTGISINTGSGGNFYLSGSTVSATVGSDPVAISVASSATAASLLLNEVTLVSGGYGINSKSSDYNINIMHSTFSSWKGYAVASVGGELLLEGSTFATPASASDKEVSLGASVSKAVILSNTYGGGKLSMDNAAPGSHVSVNDVPFSLPSLGMNGFLSSGINEKTLPALIPAQPKPARTGPDSLYDVTAYGAVADCDDASYPNCTDNTKAFQAALDAAGKAGGGTVFIPGSPKAKGYFISGNLKVPQGVELTGAPQDSAFHSINTETAIIAEGNANPLITLAASSGVRGILVWYGNQDGYAYGKFGYTIQAQGKNDWVTNVALANPTDGLDFGTYPTTGHYISNVHMAGLDNPLYISKSTQGFVVNIGSVGTFWFNIDKNQSNTSLIKYPEPKGNPPGDNCVVKGQTYPDTSVGCPADVYRQGAGIILGSATNETIIGAYMHGPREGLKTVDDNGGPSFTLIIFGTETLTGLDIQALNPAGAKIVSTQYHTLSNNCYPQNCGPIVGKPYLIISSAVPATTPITFFGYANHASTPVGFDLSGGKTIIQQYYSDQDSNDAANIQTAAAVHGAQTGFAMIGGKFINPLGTGTVVAVDSSPNVAIAGTVLQSVFNKSGPVNLAYEPTLDWAALTDTGGKQGKGGGGGGKKKK